MRNPVVLPYFVEGTFPCEAETGLVREVLRPGDTVIDVGANVGWYSSLFCELVGKSGQVLAFEPNSALLCGALSVALPLG